MRYILFRNVFCILLIIHYFASYTWPSCFMGIRAQEGGLPKIVSKLANGVCLQGRFDRQISNFQGNFQNVPPTFPNFVHRHHYNTFERRFWHKLCHFSSQVSCPPLTHCPVFSVWARQHFRPQRRVTLVFYPWNDTIDNKYLGEFFWIEKSLGWLFTVIQTTYEDLC
jgi:hypothetical protein